jgi:glycosyltransferase involved in cell wall biosynthesis
MVTFEQDRGPSSAVGIPAGRSRSISVFFPCHNEAAVVEEVVSRALTVLKDLESDCEVIVVNDGSSDQTGVIADRLATANPLVRVVHHAINRGYGGALQSGIAACTKDLIFFTDGDGQFDLAELKNLLPLIESHDIVIGYRLNRQEGIVRRFNGWAWTRLVCFLFSLQVRDIDCGFKLFRRQVFNGVTLRSAGALISTEILARAVRKGCSIAQVGVHHFPRRTGRATGAKPAVILRAFRELFRLRRQILSGD